MADTSEREVAVFAAARLLPPEQRTAYLDQTCASDASLRRRVESLLDAAEEAGTFLQEPALSRQRSAAEATATDPLVSPGVLTEAIGQRIGRYKLLQQIGQGGCGIVYMAQQEEPVRRRVALKVIKLG